MLNNITSDTIFGIPDNNLQGLLQNFNTRYILITMFLLTTILILSLLFINISFKKTLVLIIMIILLIFKMVTANDEVMSIKDLKEYYNIEIKDNQVTFTLKNSNIELRKTKTFNVIKENDNKYIFENVKKPYIRYELTEDEFREIFNKSNKPINAVNINNEIKTYN